MKLIVVIMLTTLIQVSAASYAQKVSLNEKNASLEAVFKKIRAQTGFDFVYDSRLIDAQKTVNLSFNQVDLEDALRAVLKNYSLSFEIKDKVVVLSKNAPSFLDNLIAKFKAIDVRGKVLDENGEPLVGATVALKGKNRSVKTDQNGAFFLDNVGESDKLVISFIGYQNREVDAASDMGSLTMVVADAELEEVKINAGYYNVTDKERTGNISRITSKEIEKQPVNNPLLALVGRVPGIQITQATGVPGSGVNVQIRGRNSIASGNKPLYIIDGVNYPSTRISGGLTSSLFGPDGVSPLSLINPNDIESIEILKDADATSIYGSRGANGVILVTTKRGGQGKLKVVTGISQGIGQVGHKADLLNTTQYLEMRSEAYKNDNIIPGPTDYDVNGTWDQTKTTDWQKELIGGTANITNASLNVSSGDSNNSYLIGGNYYREGTVFPGDFGFERISLRSNMRIGSVRDRFNADLTANFNHSSSALFNNGLTNNIQLAPNQPAPFDEFGKLTWHNNTVLVNPMADLLQTNNSKSDNLIGNLLLSYKIISNLVIKTSIGYSTVRRKELQKNPLSAINPSTSDYVSSNRASRFGNNFTDNLMLEPILSYNSKFDFGDIEALLGASLQSTDYELSEIRASNFSSDDLMENISAAGLLTNNSNSSRYRYSAIFARINYKLGGKYLLNITARRDGSSRFGPDKQFANFGAIGASWIFSEENFFKDNMPVLSFGKVRASYGLTGNDQISDYGYLQLWNSYINTYQGSPTLVPSINAANAAFGWENNKKLELALQLGFLESKINLDVAYYKNRSSNQLLGYPLSLGSGLQGVTANLPALVQNTGLELVADFKIIDRSKIQWSTSFNISLPNNKLVAYPNIEKSGNHALTFQVGEPLSILKTYGVSVDKQTGLYVIEDKNNNGYADNDDRHIVKFLGQKYYGGLQNNINYKQFNLSFLFSFTKQTGRSSVFAVSQPTGRNFLMGSGNQYTEVLQRWKTVNDESRFQRFGTTSETNYPFYDVSDYGDVTVVDASYIRLKNISLSWSLPKRVLSTFKVANASLNIQGQNIFTWTDYVGLDPETQGFALPPLRTITAGLNVTF